MDRTLIFLDLFKKHMKIEREVMKVIDFLPLEPVSEQNRLENNA